MSSPSRILPLLSALLLGSALHAQIPNPQPIRPPGNKVSKPEPGTQRVMADPQPLTFATHAPGDTSRLFVVEQHGVIQILDLNTLVVNPVPFLDIDALLLGTNERGLLGLAFHPDYANNGLFYVYYTRNGDGDPVIAEYAVSANPDVADVGSARSAPQPGGPSQARNSYCGRLVDYG